MKSYQQLLQHILDNGEYSDDRTGTGTQRVFGYQWRHDLSTGFPLLTTKKIFFKAVVIELCWFLKGLTNVRYLQDRGVTIWDEWALPNGDLGPVYGKQWRDFNGVDQLKNLIQDINKSPSSRRLIVSAWNPVDVPNMKLPPCHTLWQCRVSTKKKLDLHLYARSIDSFLGLPFNIASYALLVHMIAQVTGLQVGELIISFGDLHIYNNHREQVYEQLSRTPGELPQVFLNESITELDKFEPENVTLIGYEPQAAIKAPVAI